MLPGLICPRIKLGARIEQVGDEVDHRPVAVIDQNLARTAGEGARNGGIRLLGHETPRILVFEIAGLALLRQHNARHTLDINRNENLHGQ